MACKQHTRALVNQLISAQHLLKWIKYAAQLVIVNDVNLG